MDEFEKEAQLRAQQEEMLRMQQQQQQSNNYQATQQKPKKKSKVGLIILIVFICLLPVIILVAVMLTSMGVLIYNNAVTSVESEVGAMNSALVSASNSRFEAFEGDSRTLSEVRTLINLARSNNFLVEKKTDINVEIELADGTKYSLDNIISSDLSNSSKYTVSLSYNDEGYVNFISIKENN